MSKEKVEQLEDDFDIKDEKLQVGFYLNNADEKKKFEEVAAAHGINKSALMRMLILKEWRAVCHKEKEVKNV